ncbi:hypothetical protein [Dyella sp. ASV21]|uniref:hypothetical protein n=1 Tax=Dyella sp. ASV21 TaxID=2795114 RepID=UPI0018EA5B8D|nr:hypothetical protein [Dyella sp. ASV21]
MWDWIKALYDGGLSWLLMVVAATCIATAIYRHVRDWRRETWEEALVLAVLLAVFCIYPVWHLATDDAVSRISIDADPSAFTYAKMLWVNVAGVVLGRIAFSAFPALLLRL